LLTLERREPGYFKCCCSFLSRLHNLRRKLFSKQVNPLQCITLRFENSQVVHLKDETNPETVTDTFVGDIDGDGVKEIVALTHLGGIYILKLVEVLNRRPD
jgi:hypothetical protein